MKNTLSNRILMLIAIVVLANLAVLGILVDRVNEANADLSVYTQVGVEGDINVLRIARDTNFASRLARSIFLGDDFDKNFAQLAETIGAVEKSYGALKGAAEKLDQSKRSEMLKVVETARTESMAFLDSSREIIGKLKGIDRNPETLRAAWADYHKAATPLANKSRESFKKLNDLFREQREATQVATQHSLTSLVKLTPIVELIGIAIVAVLGLLIRKQIIASVGRAIGVAERVAAGDLTKPVEIGGYEEIAKMLAALQTMQNRLHDLVTRLHAADHTLRQTAGRLTGASEKVSTHTSEQHEATASMAASIQELTVSTTTFPTTPGTRGKSQRTPSSRPKAAGPSWRTRSGRSPRCPIR